MCKQKLEKNCRVCLNDEDRRRMAKLYEEVISRVQEMSLIAARIQGNRAEWHQAKLAFEMPNNTSSDETFDGIEIRQNCSGSDEECCVIYDHDEGTCSPC